jgi:acid stress-induced BolA-like protein IbaG/YrbA
MIKTGIPDAKVTIRDLAGDGDHYAAEVVSESFRGKSRVQQHQMVYKALAGQHGRRPARAGAADQRSRLREAMAGFLDDLIGEIIDGVVDGMAKGAVTRKRRRSTTRRKTTRRKTTSRRKRSTPTSTIEKILVEALTGKKPAARKPRTRRARTRTKRSTRRKSTARKR